LRAAAHQDNFDHQSEAIMTGTEKRVAILDDHPLYRAGVVLTLRDTDFVVCWEGDDVMEVAVAAAASDIVLFDWTIVPTPESMVEDMLSRYPNLRIAAISMSDDLRHVSGALRAGAAAFVSKEAGAAELLEALTLVAQGKRYVSPTLATSVLQ
jgi:DNA-binding NarL/FixJ family response regulator